MSPEELYKSMKELGAVSSLLDAAVLGHITELSCSMAICICPQGREFFEKPNPYRGPWAISADRYPVPSRLGGKYSPENVRPSHSKCNMSEGGKLGGAKNKGRKQKPRSEGLRLRMKLWAQSPEGRQILSESGKKGGARGKETISRETRSKNGTLGGYASADWARSEEGRAVKRRASKKGSCSHWNLNRGKPCRCGMHSDA